jgi:predicted nuclease of predicted toxin-antitoxin system
MKFLLNENIPPSLSELLSSIGWQSTHVTFVGLKGEPDSKIVEYCALNDYVILTHDLDYGRIVSLSGKRSPSVLTFRLEKISIEELFLLIKNNQIQITHYLSQGALVTIDGEKFRFRLLPVERK